jgi:hypothetical protein
MGSFFSHWVHLSYCPGSHGLLFDGEKFRQSRGFVELWERDPPLESLSTRRQRAKFRCVNKPEEIDLVQNRAVLPARDDEVRPPIEPKKWTSWRIGRIFFQHMMFFDIGIGIYIESQLDMFCSVAEISSKMEIFVVSENRGSNYMQKRNFMHIWKRRLQFVEGGGHANDSVSKFCLVIAN